MPLCLLPAELEQKGALASPVASLKPQSPYIGVYLRVIDNFHGEL